MSVTFSIIMPVYNAERYLRAALDSVLAQSYSNWECVCVDDGSTDSSPSVLDEYAKNDCRIKIIHQDNRGVAVARNVGLDRAQGQWITWLDADDIYAPWRLAAAERIISETTPDLIRFRAVMGADGENVDFVRGCSHLLEGEDLELWLWNVFIPWGMMWATVVRRDLWTGIRFVPNMRIKEEFPVCARLALRMRRVVQSESSAYYYRQSLDSAMHSVRKAEDCLFLLRAVDDFVRNHPHLDQIAQIRLRMHCECDIIDWVLMREGEHDRAREIFALYKELKGMGIFSSKSIQQARYRLPMWWWDRTGQVWPIVLVDRFVRVARFIRQRLGR